MPYLTEIEHSKLQQELSDKGKRIEELEKGIEVINKSLIAENEKSTMLAWRNINLKKEIASVNDFFKKELKEDCKKCGDFDDVRRICSLPPETVCALKHKIIWLDKLTEIGA